MKFLVDDQLPPMLAGVLGEFDVVARHIADIGMGGASDSEIWRLACADEWIVVTKDADFVHFHAAVTPPRGRILWLRIGNTRKPVLAAAIRAQLPACLAAFVRGETLVEIR